MLYMNHLAAGRAITPHVTWGFGEWVGGGGEGAVGCIMVITR